MHPQRIWLILGICGAILLPLGVFAAVQSDSRYFAATGHTVRGDFLAYWEDHGGLAQQGYPLTEEMQEFSARDGKTYTVQYFERAVFERHPEYAGTPYEVLLSLAGADTYQQKYPDGAPGQRPNTDPGTQLFPTGKHLGGSFLAYWQSHGGLAQQGYPVSEEFTETSALDGKPYTVQYFERAVFEWHPENHGTPYEVLLSQLGTYRYQAQYGALIIPPASGRIQSDPQGSNSYIVWNEQTLDANGIAVPGSFDLRALQLQTSRPLTVTDAPDDQVYPAIAGSTVVWLNRRAACPPCIVDIQGKNLDTGSTFTVASNNAIRGRPVVGGHAVAWVENDVVNTRLLLKNLDTGVVTTVATAPSSTPERLSNPRMSDEYLVWVDAGVPAGDPHYNGPPYTVWAYDLTTGQRTVAATGVVSVPYWVPAPVVLGHYLAWDGPDLRFVDLHSGQAALLNADFMWQLAIGGDTIVWSGGPSGLNGLRLNDRRPVTLLQTRVTGPPAIAGDWLVWQDGTPGAEPSRLQAARLSALFAQSPPPPPLPAPTAPPTPLPSATAPPTPMLEATNVVGQPVTAGKYLFYATTGAQATSIYAYDGETGSAPIVRTVAGGIGGLATDGRSVVWEEPGPAFSERIQALDLGANRMTTLLDSSTVSETFGLPFAYDAGTLYYQGQAPGHTGLYARPASGGERLVSPNGEQPVAADGRLLWSERQVQDDTGQGGLIVTTCTLHLSLAVPPISNRTIATLHDYPGGTCAFDGYRVSGDNVVWSGVGTGANQVHLYNIAADTTRIISAQAGSNPFIQGNRVVWNAGPGAPSAWTLVGYNLTTSATTTLLTMPYDPIFLAGIVGQRMVAYTIPGPDNTRSLYRLPLEANP